MRNLLVRFGLISSPFSKSNNSLNVNNNEILNLNNELNKAKKIIEQQKLLINDLRNKIYNYNITLNNYKNVINQKDIELNNFKNQSYNNNYSINNIMNKTFPPNKIYFNEIMCVNFISTDQKLHFAIPCRKTDTFAEVEEKLYQKFPEYRETNNNFVCNGKCILRFKTISENNVGNGLPVTLIVP